LPPLNLPNTPNAKPAPVTPTSLAESIEVTGVVQVGGKWSVIVKEPHTSSSRYVSVGEYLGNGRVLVKKILSPGTTEPVVVLQQNGVEIRKTLV
jgi:Tfp pilus assembly protein PilP